MDFVVPEIRVRQNPQFFIRKKLRSDYLIFKELSFLKKSKLFDYNKIKEKVKKWLIAKAELYFSTADEHDSYYLMYGASKGKIVRYPFSSVSKKDILEKTLSNEEKLLNNF